MGGLVMLVKIKNWAGSYHGVLDILHFSSQFFQFTV